MDGEYSMYWETKRFFDCEELEYCRWGLDEAFSGCSYESSSPERPLSSSATTTTTTTAATTSKNVLTERKRRKMLNERLYSLRSIVPNITKMDKASVIKDAISYIQQLQEQERRMAAEISDQLMISAQDRDHHKQQQPDDIILKRKRSITRTSSIEVSELRVRAIEDKTMGISMACKKKRGTMMMLCELFESLNLKTITASITCVSEEILHTLVVETEDMDCAQLKEKIENAIKEINAQQVD